MWPSQMVLWPASLKERWRGGPSAGFLSLAAPPPSGESSVGVARVARRLGLERGEQPVEPGHARLEQVLGAVAVHLEHLDRALLLGHHLARLLALDHHRLLAQHEPLDAHRRRARARLEEALRRLGICPWASSAYFSRKRFCAAATPGSGAASSGASRPESASPAPCAGGSSSSSSSSSSERLRAEGLPLDRRRGLARPASWAASRLWIPSWRASWRRSCGSVGGRVV